MVIADLRHNHTPDHLFAHRCKNVSAVAVFCGAMVLFTLACGEAQAAPSDRAVNGAALGLVWMIPFAGLLLSIAVLPLIAPIFWHGHYGKVAGFWAFAFLAPFYAQQGGVVSQYELVHAIVLDYIPFIILIFSLYTIAGGIYISGDLRGSPSTNLALLGIGTSLASFLGTTGASMVMIQPVLRANEKRKHNAHVFVFFIFLVSNIGGSLTPLGDPPLFMGFMNGVDFFWPTRHVIAPALLIAMVLLCAFFALDTYFYAKDTANVQPAPSLPVRVHGLINAPLLLLLIAAIIVSGVYRDFAAVHILGVEVKIAGVLRDVFLLGLAALSLALTPKTYRELNRFNWGPCIEVAKLFLAIFITIIPAIAILKAGSNGAMADTLSLLTHPDGAPNNLMYFWLTGGLSGFLDNAPTYLIFFNAAGGDAERLMGPLQQTLLAISAGAVFMGANTYIGNAPNLMVKSIVEHAGVRMPSFIGYIGWSLIFLTPCFIAVSVIFFA